MFCDLLVLADLHKRQAGIRVRPIAVAVDVVYESVHHPSDATRTHHGEHDKGPFTQHSRVEVDAFRHPELCSDLSLRLENLTTSGHFETCGGKLLDCEWTNELGPSYAMFPQFMASPKHKLPMEITKKNNNKNEG